MVVTVVNRLVEDDREDQITFSLHRCVARRQFVEHTPYARWNKARRGCHAPYQHLRKIRPFQTTPLQLFLLLSLLALFIHRLG